MDIGKRSEFHCVKKSSKLCGLGLNFRLSCPLKVQTGTGQFCHKKNCVLLDMNTF